MSSILLKFLMVILMAGVIFTDSDVDNATDSTTPTILRVLSKKLLSGTFTYLEDVLHPPEVPDGDLDGWGHFH